MNIRVDSEFHSKSIQKRTLDCLFLGDLFRPYN